MTAGKLIPLGGVGEGFGAVFVGDVTGVTCVVEDRDVVEDDEKDRDVRGGFDEVVVMPVVCLTVVVLLTPVNVTFNSRLGVAESAVQNLAMYVVILS